MSSRWTRSAHLLSGDASDNPEDAPWGYIGEVGFAISSDGTKILASSETWGSLSRAYLWEKGADGWTLTAELDPASDFYLWKDTFDGDLSKEKLTADLPSGGSVLEAGGKLTITTPAVVASDWMDCPVAWRYDAVNYKHHFYTTVSALSAIEGARAGICLYTTFTVFTRDTAALLEVAYSAGEYSLQISTVESGIVTGHGSATSIADPNVTPVEIQFIYDYYMGFVYWWYRQGGTTWIPAGQMLWRDMVCVGTKAGLFVRRAVGADAIAASFDEFALRGATYFEPGDVAITDGVAVVARQEGIVQSEIIGDFTPVLLPGDEFGFALSAGYQYASLTSGINECIVAVGAPGDNGNAGAVYLLNWQKDNTWAVVQKLVGSDTVAGDRFGAAVGFLNTNTHYSRDTDYLFIGAPQHAVAGDAGAGAVYLFQRQVDGTWAEANKIVATASAPNNNFGFALEAAYIGTTYDHYLLVGLPGQTANMGGVEAFRRTAATGVWASAWSAIPADGAVGDRYGHAVCIRAYAAYIGAPEHNAAAGAVYCLNYTTGAFVHKLVAPDAVAGDQFGYAVDRAGRYEYDVIVGAPGRDGNKGGIYSFDTRAPYAHKRTIAPGYLQTNDRFGCAIGHDWQRMVVGASGNGVQAGFAQLFHDADSDGTAFTDVGKMVPSGIAAADNYGAAVVLLHYRHFFVGAPGTNLGSGRGVAGFIGHNTGGSGWGPSSLDIHRKAGGVWYHAEQLTPSMQWIGDGHGLRLAISKDGKTIASSPQAWLGYGEYAVRIYRDAGSGFVLDDALLPEIPTVADPNLRYIELTHAYANTHLNEDGTKLVTVGYGDQRAWSESAYDAAIENMSTVIPNPDCTISKTSSRLQILADATNNPADWAGSGSWSCPIAYAAPIPLLAGSHANVYFDVELYDIDTADPDNAFAGAALYDDAAQDALIIEYNRTTKRVHIWSTTGGGVKTPLHQSTELLDLGATPYRLYMRFVYDPDTNQFQTRDFHVSSTFKDLTVFSCVLPFTPTKFGVFSRVAAPATSTSLAKFFNIGLRHEYSGKVHVHTRGGGGWALTDEFVTYEAPGVNKVGLFPHTYHHVTSAMSTSGEWLSIHVVESAGTHSIDIYRDSGGGFVFLQRITAPYTDFDAHAIADGVLGRAILSFSAQVNASNKSTFFYVFDGSSFKLDSAIDTTDIDWVMRAAFDETGSTLALSNPYETVNPDDYGAVYVFSQEEPEPTGLDFSHSFEVTRIDSVSSNLRPRQILNQFDEHGLVAGVRRNVGEKNWSYRRRIYDAWVNIANSSYRGLINGITRELGLELFEAVSISPKKRVNSELFYAPDPYIKVEGPTIYLYSNYIDGVLDYELDRWTAGGNLEKLGWLIDFINSTTYFEGYLHSGVSRQESSMILLNQTNRECVYNEFIPASNKFRLKNKRIVEGTIFFSNRVDFRREVLTEGDVGRAGDFFINYNEGIVVCYSPSVVNNTVRYQYIVDPFTLLASPIIINDINNEEFKTKLFGQILLDDGTNANCLPNELGTDIINELLTVVPLYFGV